MSFLRQLPSTAFDRRERTRLLVFYSIIGITHVLGWGLLINKAMKYPALIGLGALAYSFGLRHAFDADHISAIDNTTRKLLQDGKKPIGVGFFFSLGHSIIVLIMALVLGFTSKALVDGIMGGGELRNIGALISTSVSGTFLLLIGILNLIILLEITGTYRRMKRGAYRREALEQRLVTGGVLTRLFGRLFKVITHSWQMLPIGLLFGLGFDTASEIALLAISVSASTQALPVTAVVSIPVVFAGGMMLMDTTDGAFMAKAYSWAFSNPVRKLFYNMTITGLSVFVALFLGVIELLQIVSQILGLKGGIWSLLGSFDLGRLGFVIVGAFVATWVLAISIFKLRRVEERWTALVDA